MGCSFETAKHNCRINDTFDTVCHTPIITPTSRTRSIYAKTATIHYQLDSNNNNSICNQYNPKLDKTNDDCQQQKSAKAKKNTTISATTISCSNIFNCSSNSSSSNSNDSNGYTIRDELKRTLSFYSLEAKEHIYRNSHNSLKLEGKGVKLTESEEEILQESCANCYPLACHNRICCRQQNLIEGEIINHTSHCLESQPKYFNTNSCSNSICNCACVSNNSKCSCHCLASSYFCQKHKNTLRNEISRGTQGVVDCTKGAVYTKADPMPKTYFPRGQCLQRVLSHAKIALTSNTLDMKNGLAEAMGNCVKIVESLLSRSNTNTTQCRKHCMGNKTSNQITNTHNHKDNNNKSEPYRGYCQRKHHTLKPDFIPYTSTNSSCSLHDAISSKQIKQQQQHQQQYSNIKSNTNNNKVTLGKSCNNCHNATTTSTPTQTAAFNYIGHNYYHFLRNSINFYTAYTASVILVLCYLTTTTSAATPKSDATSLDKHPIFDESSSDKEILDLLLEQKRYDKRLLPPVHGTLNVNVTVLLLSLASPDESSLKYEVEFLLNQFWVDPRLQYGNKSHYDFLNALHHHDSIWTPDTYFSMHGDFKDPIIPMHFALRIFRNGTIMYSMRRHLILSCQGSLHIFPFDDPKCTFSMESISYEEPQIRYVWTNGEVTLLKSPSLTTLNAYLIKNQTTACEQHSWRGNYSCLRVDLIFTRDRAFYFTTVFIPGIILVTSSFITFWLEWNAVPARSMIGNYSCLQVDLTFTRDRAYYFTTVFIPGIILVTSSFITFWLEWNAVPARVMIGVTTMLNFFTTSNGFRSTLPVVSNLTAMNVWDGVCMCFIYASLLEFVCVNYMGRKRPQHNVVYRPGENPVTQRLPAVLSRIGVILASPLEIVEREFNAAMSSEKAAAGISSAGTSMVTTPRPGSPQTEAMPHLSLQRQQSSGIIASAVQNLRARSVKRRNVKEREYKDPGCPLEQGNGVYEHIYAEPGGVTTFAAVPSVKTTTVTIETDIDEVVEPPKLKRSYSMSTNTPPLVCRGAEVKDGGLPQTAKTFEVGQDIKAAQTATQVEAAQMAMPIKPPRRKSSRSTSPINRMDEEKRGQIERPPAGVIGEKKRDTGGPNEIVACTTCGGNSGTPCTHSANNGCATETCFVQVRKKEPPHPIRIAKTIDVIARITFPTAYAIFLIFFFVHYKGFS